MPSVRSIRRVKPKIWIPPGFSAIYKFEVIRTDGTVDNITNEITSLEIEDGVTDNIGRFSFELWNPSEKFTGIWANMDSVKYYSDYASAATTLRFTGRIEKISYRGNKIKVIGRSEAVLLANRTVTKQFEDTETSVILNSLLTSYATEFTNTNVNTSTKNLTVNWYNKPFWDAVNELCEASGFDCYADANKDFHYFESGSIVNTSEAIVHDYNQIEVGDFGEDLMQMRNRVIVYGAQQDGIQTLYTSEDTTSQALFGITKETIINDSNITNATQAKEVADSLLDKNKNPVQVGEVKGILLATIQPGEKIRLSSPMDNLPPGDYKIISYKHNVGQTGFYTTVRVTKEPRRITHVISNIIGDINKKKETFINPFEMRFSKNFLYDEDEGTHSNTEVVSGVLKSTAATGTWTSPVTTTSNNITQAYLIAIGETLTGVTFEISADNGENYQSILDKQRITLTSSAKNLIIKVNFTNTDTQIDSLSVLYK